MSRNNRHHDTDAGAAADTSNLPAKAAPLPPTAIADDSFAAELDAGREAASRELAVVMEAVRYGAFMDLDPPLPVDAFLRIRHVAMADRFFSYDDAALAARLRLTPAQLEEARSHVHYPRIFSEITTAARRVNKLSTIDEIAQEVSVRVGKDMALIAARGSNRERQASLNALADRVAPKKTRADVPTTTRVFPPEVLELIKLGMELGEGRAGRARSSVIARVDDVTAASPPLAADYDDDAVDAEVLRLPSESERDRERDGARDGDDDGG